MSHPFNGEYHEDKQLEGKGSNVHIMQRYRTLGSNSSRYRTDWGRVISWFLICIALTVTLMSCQAAHADELPIPVQTIIGECANCSDDGMMAVANVIRNRMELRGQTAEEVCLAKWQFSFWNDRGRAKNFIKNASSLVIDRAWSAWQVSATEDLTGGADHYFAKYIKMPSWAKNMDFKGQFGVHRFYSSTGL